MHDKPDRRSQRTRQLLSGALADLLVERPFRRISIKEIIGRANVGRSTFYAHYDDKHDLLAGSFERVLEELSRESAAHDGTRPLLPVVGLFRHLREQHHLYAALAGGEGAQLLFDRGHAYLVRTLQARLAALLAAEGEPAVPLRIVAEYMAGALMALSKSWLEGGMPDSPEAMEAMYERLVMPGVRAALEPAG